MHPAWIEINIEQFKKNLHEVKGLLKDTKLCLPVKANAYGHGLYEISKAAQDCQVDYLAVAHLKEAVFLRNNGIHIPILVLGAIHEEQIEALLTYDLEFSISSHYKAQMVEKICLRLNKTAKVHVEVDTGMGRTGMRVKTALSLLKDIYDKSVFHIKGVYCHLAKAEEPFGQATKKQIQNFLALKDLLGSKGQGLVFHGANSLGTILRPDFHLDMVRPALLCFGHAPFDSKLPGIRPFFSVKAKISYVKEVFEGEGVSYGHTFVAQKKTRVVTIPVGYGDGYRRDLSNKAQVLICGKKYPIIGNICMDQFMVDVGDTFVKVGDEAVLVGNQGKEEISITTLAKLCHTIPYEILCGFNDRMPRIYFGL